MLDSAQDGRLGSVRGEPGKDAVTGQDTAIGDDRVGPNRLVQAWGDEQVSHEASTSSGVRACAVSEHPHTLWRYGGGLPIPFNLFKIIPGRAS
ncbi:hypothetical protein ACFV0O_25495 [Kitasatospora sp. NPDC059577]|uniref:hypothetical protein n=1 Tax=Kitasatospora sp. NPDC059577 TaxID=3346873 RepID=UPI003699B693